MEWEIVIGLEVHVQLSTQSKIFSGSATAYGAAPNTQANAIDLGLPGVLPVLNKEVVTKAVKFGLAIDAAITPNCVFARKNYFYPDLPKGYQISQFDLPIVAGGHVDIPVAGGSKRIQITRAHLEEDAGKSVHETFAPETGIDLNRAGTPLLEIVSEPDLRSATEAVTYLKAIHSLVRYLDISDGNMQEGSFRCDANVSVRPKGQTELTTRTEIKNINSFRFVERAINYEAQRQIDLIDSGESVQQQTRLYDADKNETRAMRSKEEANDYRYFPDPDLLPVAISQEDIKAIAATLPELPKQKIARFMQTYELNPDDANLLVSSIEMADYFETVASATQAPKLAAAWLCGEVTANLNKEAININEVPLSAEQLAGLIARIQDDTISGKIAKTVFEAMWQGEGSADEIIEKQGLQQVTNVDTIEAIVDTVIQDSPQQLEQYRSGKDKLFGYFVGQVMKATGGKANPKLVNELLNKKLSS